MENAFKESFAKYACVGDTITAEKDGFIITARIKYDDCKDKPDERQDGFWPSLNPEDAGYIGDGKTRADLKKEYDKAAEIMESWKNDGWFYCGIVLSVSKAVVIPGRTQKEVTISDHAASLWGIECNFPHSDNVRLTEVANELLDEAIEHATACIKQIA